MARLELVHAGAAAPPAPSLVVAAGDVAASGDGLLRLLDGRCFALEVAQEGQLRVRLGEPWAALCALPHAAGLLASARGSRRLLFCPHPASLAAGQAADAFLLGEHDGEQEGGEPAAGKACRGHAMHARPPQ